MWARNTEDYDLLIYVANWPEKRVNAWDALLKARAIENMSYCIGLNRTGEDGDGFVYNGHSAAYDVLGNAITDLNRSEEFVEEFELSKKEMLETREKLKFPVIVQLTNIKGEILAEKYSEDRSNFTFNYLNPGDILVRVIFDSNANQKWDTGNFLKKIQPERIQYLRDTLEVRANWDQPYKFSLD